MFLRRFQNFNEFTELNKELRQKLGAHFSIARPTVDRIEISADGTRKYRFVGADGAAFEAVYIPEVAAGRKTNTLCISSQTGCPVGCEFCYTATLKHHRNLDVQEITGQVLVVQQDVAALGEGARVSNIVFMGMGEPLLNYDRVLKAARMLIDDHGFGFSTRRVTISTAGIVPRIADLGRDLGVQLAVSLNATTDEVRDRLMPINKKWPLADLLAALRAYPLPNRRRITIEYVLLAGVNDSQADARRLVKLLNGIQVKINLLPLNGHDKTALCAPEPDVVAGFAAELRKRGMSAILRTPRGKDIAAACGLLGESELSPEV